MWSWSALVNGRVSPSYPTLVRSAQLLEASVACLRSLLSSPASASGILSPPPHAVPEATNDPKPIWYSRHACLNVRNEKCEMPLYEIDSHLCLKPFRGSPRTTPRPTEGLQGVESPLPCSHQRRWSPLHAPRGLTAAHHRMPAYGPTLLLYEPNANHLPSLKTRRPSMPVIKPYITSSNLVAT